MAKTIKSITKPAPVEEAGGFDDSALAAIQGAEAAPYQNDEAYVPPVAGPSIGHNSGNTNPSAEAAAKLKQFIAAIETMEEEKKEIAGAIRDKYAEAKSMGYDPKALRTVVRRRAQDRQEREEFEAIVDTYEHALEFYD